MITIESINNNKYFYAIMMLLMNMGARYIELDLDSNHKNFLSSKVIRRLLIFTVSFIATRDIVASLIITSAFVIIVLNLFSTKSRYFIMSKDNKILINDDNVEIPPHEIKKAYNILKKLGKIR